VIDGRADEAVVGYGGDEAAVCRLGRHLQFQYARSAITN